jgi:peptidoglycan/LPS O-acetylase OafA/YrhL
MGGEYNCFSLAWWIVRLDLGVKVFFAISGFVLALPFTKYYLFKNSKKIQMKQYFLRRLTRLEPPFIITLIAFYFLHLLLFNVDGVKWLVHLSAGIFYCHGFIFGRPNPIIPVTWSLETEAQFYIILPLIMIFLFSIRSIKTRWLFIVLFFLISMFLKHNLNNNPFLNKSILVYFMNFQVGIILAWFYVKSPNWFLCKEFLYDIIGVFSLIGLFYFYKPQDDYLNQIFFNVSIFFFILSVFKSILLNWFFTRSLIYLIGGMCYSIYLIHYAFFHLSVKYTLNLWVLNVEYADNYLFQILLNIPLVILISTLFFVLFERPFMDKFWVRKLLKNEIKIYNANWFIVIYNYTIFILSIPKSSY